MTLYKLTCSFPSNTRQSPPLQTGTAIVAAKMMVLYNNGGGAQQTATVEELADQYSDLQSLAVSPLTQVYNLANSKWSYFEEIALHVAEKEVDLGPCGDSQAAFIVYNALKNTFPNWGRTAYSIQHKLAKSVRKVKEDRIAEARRREEQAQRDIDALRTERDTLKDSLDDILHKAAESNTQIARLNNKLDYCELDCTGTKRAAICAMDASLELVNKFAKVAADHQLMMRASVFAGSEALDMRPQEKNDLTPVAMKTTIGDYYKLMRLRV